MTATPLTPASETLPVQPSTRARTYRQTSLVRLAILELRKFAATRAGIGLTIGAALLMGGLALANSLLGGASGHTLAGTLQVTVFNASMIMPVIAVMVFTSEWTTRATMTTFALTPQRWRIVTAKIAAVVVLALLGYAFALAASAFGTVVTSSSPADPWNLSVTMFLQTGAWTILSALGGAALASLLLITPAAIVAIFLAPSLVELLGMWDRLREPLQWIDQGDTMARLAEAPLQSGDVTHVLAGAAFWVALPFALGVRRMLRSDIG